ncbi:MAG: hypothetical protein QOF02_2038 [Blastocatellia bacterium]|jgi:hypothetical protein|nr:hypothetical protein [Blastocatellia bacterium]
MSTFKQTNSESHNRPTTDGYSRTDTPAHTTFQQANNSVNSRREVMNQSSRVQSQMQLQQMLNASPRVVAQAKLAETLNSRNDSRQGQPPVQLQESLEDEELTQRQATLEEEEPLQGKFAPLQREETPEDEEPLQSKSEPLQKRENKTGLPDNLKAGVEHLSGLSMDDVKVHYNSAAPATVQALAYTQGTDIHVGPGQEQHLAHEAWHVAQQKQGRVQPTTQAKGVAINDDRSLEAEADKMGHEAAQLKSAHQARPAPFAATGKIIQMVVLPLDDVAALTREQPTPTKKKLDSAQVITDAVADRINEHPETVARPWDTRFRPFKWGPLDGIGNEEIRIYGHGGHASGEEFVRQVGGYTATNLVNLLKELGLESTYGGMIYLSGCKTAAGDDAGYLGNFYELLKPYAPNVKVKGNLGNAITLKNGNQAIFKSKQDRDLYQDLRDTVNRLAESHMMEVDAFEQMPKPTTSQERKAVLDLKTELLQMQKEIIQTRAEMKAIFFAEETEENATLTLPSEKKPSFDRHAFDLFEDPIDISAYGNPSPIQDLLAKTDTLSSVPVTFSKRKQTVGQLKHAAVNTGQTTMQLQASSTASGDGQAIQRKVVTVRTSEPADEASEESQWNTMNNLRLAKQEDVVDTAFNMGDQPLGALGVNETLYVLGHGTGATISGKSPEELLRTLQAFGYTNAHQGLIDLVSCSSAIYLKGFQQALTGGGYVNHVKGYGGLVHVTATGDFEVVPEASAGLYLEIKNKAKSLYEKEKASLDDKLSELREKSMGASSAEIESTLRQSAKLDRDYQYIIEQLNGLFEPAAKHEAFSSVAAWKKHGTPSTLDDWIK